MKQELVHRLILYLVDQLDDLDAAISKIRIVKLLYIIDLEYYRSYGETLTKLDWIYYHFGPYAFAIDTAIKRSKLDLGEESFETLDGYKGFTYHANFPQKIDDLVNSAVKFKINQIINHWAWVDTRDLLDYVYNETEPMQNAVYLQPLDFSSINRNVRVSRHPRHIKLSPEKSSIIQSMLQQRKKQRDLSEITPPRYDELFDEAMLVLNSEDTFQNPQDEGSISISTEAIRALKKKSE